MLATPYKEVYRRKKKLAQQPEGNTNEVHNLEAAIARKLLQKLLMGK